VHAGDDDDPFRVDPVVEAVGESLEERSPCLSVKGGKCLRSLRQDELGRLNGEEELVAKPLSPSFVPDVRIFDVRGGRGPKDDRSH